MHGNPHKVGLIDRYRYSPFLVQLVVTRKCNLACGYCSEFDKVSAPVPTEVLKERIDHLRRLGSFAVEFTGGEPMLHPDIYDLVRHVRARGFFKCMLISNAYLLNAEKVRKLNDAGLQEMQISIDGVKTNDITVKVLDPLRKKLETVAREARFKVVLNSVMGSAPGEEVLEVIDFATKLGFRPRVQIIHDDKGQMAIGDGDREVIEQIRLRLGRKFLDGGDYRIQLLENGRAPFKCRAGSRYLYIDEHGYVRWCSQTREVWGKPLAEYGPEDLERQFKTTKNCADLCTVGCVRNCSHPDRWRAQPLADEVAQPAAASNA